jgi:hypothetical protein
MRKFLVFTIALATLFTACKKDLTPAEILQTTVWKMSAYSENGIASTLQPCTVDDKFTFSVSGSYEHNYGTSKCNIIGANSLTGNWSVEADGKSLKLVTTVLGISKSTLYSIKSIEEAKFVLTYEVSSTGGTVKVIEETYVPAQ